LQSPLVQPTSLHALVLRHWTVHGVAPHDTLWHALELAQLIVHALPAVQSMSWQALGDVHSTVHV
jgi:hypothetical protein